jgi:hypothetical protein
MPNIERYDTYASLLFRSSRGFNEGSFKYFAFRSGIFWGILTVGMDITILSRTP